MSSTHWSSRDFAIRIARAMGRPERAIAATVAAYADSKYATRQVSWWNDRIAERSAEVAA